MCRWGVGGESPAFASDIHRRASGRPALTVMPARAAPQIPRGAAGPQAEEKRNAVARERDVSGPRIKYVSRRNGDSVISCITFTETPIPAAIDAIAPPYPAPARCVVTNAIARYCDPSTGCAYATLEAFKMLRGRTGRRHHSFGGAGAPSAADD